MAHVCACLQRATDCRMQRGWEGQNLDAGKHTHSSDAVLGPQPQVCLHSAAFAAWQADAACTLPACRFCASQPLMPRPMCYLRLMRSSLEAGRTLAVPDKLAWGQHPRQLRHS
jgi:hypothetical protein